MSNPLIGQSTCKTAIWNREIVPRLKLRRIGKEKTGERDAYLDIFAFVNNAGKLLVMMSITCLLVAVLVKTNSFTLPLSVSCFNSLELGTRKESSCLKSTKVLFSVRFLGLADIIDKITTSLAFSDLP